MKKFIFLVLIFTSSAVFAAPKTVQDWLVDLTVEYSESYTYNETQSLFGMICYDKCIYYLSPVSITCQEGSEYSILMNAESDSRAIDTRCIKMQDKFIRVLLDFDTVHKATLNSTYIGFAFSVKGGAFNVSRFSLKGAKSAITQALTNSLNTKKNSSNRDTRL